MITRDAAEAVAFRLAAEALAMENERLRTALIEAKSWIENGTTGYHREPPLERIRAALSTDTGALRVRGKGTRD